MLDAESQNVMGDNEWERQSDCTAPAPSFTELMSISASDQSDRSESPKSVMLRQECHITEETGPTSIPGLRLARHDEPQNQDSEPSTWLQAGTMPKVTDSAHLGTGEEIREKESIAEPSSHNDSEARLVISGVVKGDVIAGESEFTRHCKHRQAMPKGEM